MDKHKTLEKRKGQAQPFPVVHCAFSDCSGIFLRKEKGKRHSRAGERCADIEDWRHSLQFCAVC